KGTWQSMTMDDSSSAVRSLVDINFYLHCAAEEGDLLMVDEPELSLHPENQRRIAKLFARLANIGVKVFITTHSDYIVKELNTLIMLNHDKPHLKRVAEENGYQDSELINTDQVKLYMTEEKLMPLEEGQKRRRRGYTLVPANIDPEFGIEVGSFDKTIDDMNRIQKDIVWGAK
ncbi:ATP-binding protein, partial [Candidatus Poribacteria bacterium]|nr:ATP-binding protein [Candidatus Poribacteria bacterium]